MDAASQSRIGLLVVHNTRHKKIHQHSVFSSQARIAIVPRKVIKYVDLLILEKSIRILPFLTFI